MDNQDWNFEGLSGPTKHHLAPLKCPAGLVGASGFLCRNQSGIG